MKRITVNKFELVIVKAAQKFCRPNLEKVNLLAIKESFTFALFAASHFT